MSELFNESELRNLLERDEGQFLEFKSLWDLSGDSPRALDRRTVRDCIAEYVAAFANADGGPTAEWQSVVAGLELTNTQKRALLAYPNGFSNEEYRKINGLDRDQAYREIQDIVTKGVLQPAAALGRGAVYRFSAEVRSAVAWLEQRAPQLQAFFESHERLTNTDYRELTGLARYSAVRELAKLVEGGFLTMAGERRGTHYLPGPTLSSEGEA